MDHHEESGDGVAGFPPCSQLESHLNKALKLSENIFCEYLPILYNTFLDSPKQKERKKIQTQVGEMSFQGLSEDGTKYSFLLAAKRQEKPISQACNVIIPTNRTSLPKRASVAQSACTFTATPASLSPLIVHSNYYVLWKPFLA